MAKKKKKEKEKVEKLCTFFLKTSQSIQIKGFEQSNENYLLFAQEDGRVHKVERSAISVEIEHLSEIPEHLQVLTTTEKNTVRMVLKSGLNLNFDGWKIKGQVDHFLSSENDLIKLYEDYTYLSYGTFIPKEVDDKKQLKLVEKDGKERTLH